MQTNRRSFIITAALGAVVPSLVRAETLKGMPLIDPTSKRGMIAAQSWATDTFSEMPGCRLTFSDGTSYSWMNYSNTRRGNAYAVAIEVATTNERGQRIVTSIPIDGVGLERQRVAKIKEEEELWATASRMREENRSHRKAELLF